MSLRSRIASGQASTDSWYATSLARHWAAVCGSDRHGCACAPNRRTGHGGGKVLGPDGKAVEGARVTLQPSDGTPPETTVTNTQGQFWFPMLATGLYDLRAYSKGRLSDWRKNVWVEPGHQSTITLSLSSKKLL
jgi:carboxypeptidase family protein